MSVCLFALQKAIVYFSKGRTRKAEGTENPHKHRKPDWDKPGWILEKDSDGKWISKPAPSGFIEYWNKKHAEKPMPE